MKKKILPLSIFSFFSIFMMGCEIESPARQPVEFYYYINADQDILGTSEDGTIESQGELLAKQIQSLAKEKGKNPIGFHIYLDRGIPLHSGDETDSEFFNSCGDTEDHQTLGETDSTQPENFKNLLDQRCFRNAKRFIIFFSHGDGFRAQKDYDYNPQSDLFHIANLLDIIPDHFAEGVVFDSCSMASIEIASLLYQKSKFMVGSQFELPNEGLQYAGLIGLLTRTQESIDILTYVAKNSEKRFKEMEFNIPVIVLNLENIPSIISEFKKSWADTAAIRSEAYTALRNSTLRGPKDGDLVRLSQKTMDKTLRTVLASSFSEGRGSLSFGFPLSPMIDPDFETIRIHFPTLFRIWSETLPNWAEYASVRSTAPNVQPITGVTL